ncbi:uncharacterized protein J5F26_006716 [Ciconia maguari]
MAALPSPSYGVGLLALRQGCPMQGREWPSWIPISAGSENVAASRQASAPQKLHETPGGLEYPPRVSNGGAGGGGRVRGGCGAARPSLDGARGAAPPPAPPRSAPPPPRRAPPRPAPPRGRSEAGGPGGRRLAAPGAGSGRLSAARGVRRARSEGPQGGPSGKSHWRQSFLVFSHGQGYSKWFPLTSFWDPLPGQEIREFVVAGACGCLRPGRSLESQVWALMAPLPKVSVKLQPSFCLLKEKLPLEHPKRCLLQGVHQLARIGCGDAGVTCPRRGGDDGCAASHDMVAVRIENRSLRCSGTACRQSVAGPCKDGRAAAFGLGLSHRAPPC